MSDISRRDFVETTTKAAFGAMIVPRFVLGGKGYQPPSRTLNVAMIGFGGMGMENMRQFVKGGENIVAVCDVDYAYVERSLAGRLRPPTPPASATAEQVQQMKAVYEVSQKTRDAYVKAKKYDDFREMLAKQKDIDAVVVATPDHLHAIIAKTAMQAGKHVYVQKPLTYSVHESRVLADLARQTRVVTQMGNQGHSLDGTRRINELIASGILGRISEVHVWTDRPYRYWAQGIPRPTQSPTQVAQQQTTTPPATPPAPLLSPITGQPLPPAPPGWNVRTVERAILKQMAEDPQTPPPGLHWDLFLGPAGDIPYHPAYHPFAWRGWVDFGVSAIGDMGAHLIDQPYWSLGLTQPTAVSATSTPWGGRADNPASYPAAMYAQYEFPAVGARPAVKLFWYDGGLMPPRPPFLPDDQTLPRGDGGGGVFIGERGILIYETYGNRPRVYPESLAAEAEKVPQSFPRITVPHEINFAQACKGEAKASAPFEYSAALTETMLLGIAALRAGQGRLVRYDANAMKFTNAPDADQWLTRVYRPGWEV